MVNKNSLGKGYKIIKCDGPTQASQCNIACNDMTHHGTAHVQCTTDGSDFVFSGCIENQCYAPEGDSNVLSLNFQ